MSEATNQRICPNCNESSSKEFNFCPNCGQDKGSSIITFKELVSDFLGSLISFDAKVFSTIPKLLFKPGKLTKEYIEGKRDSQLSPFRLYLFLSVILILLLSLVMKDTDDLLGIDVNETSEILDSLNLVLHQDSINKTNENLNFKTSKPSDNNSIANVNFDNADLEELELLSKANKLIKEGYSIDEASDSLLQNYGFWKRFTIEQTLKLQHNKGSGLFAVFLKTSSYGMFLFLPLFALILKLLYRRRKRFYIEHFIFTLHFFCFIFFVLMLFALLNLLPFEIPRWVMLVLIIGYLYLAMQKFYNQSWGKTLLKCFSLFFLTMISIGPLMLILVALVSFLFY